MDAIVLQVLNGLDKGGAYALIALGLTLVFGTLGVVNFAHGGETVDASRWPKLAAYVERIHARPSFKALIEEEKAGIPG